MRYRSACVEADTSYHLPSNKRVPFGWRAVAVGGSPERKIRLHWQEEEVVTCKDEEQAAVWLRITAALDVREEILLEIVTSITRRCIGLLDIRYASALQPFELELRASEVEAIISEGVELSMRKGNGSFWMLLPDPARIDQAPVLFPHLLLASQSDMLPAAREQRMLCTLASLSSLQPFGWLEGCVLDGLLDVSIATQETQFLATIRAHLSMYLDQSGSLMYEDPLSEPADGKVYGIEGTLPFAVWARLEPEQPVLDLAIHLWMSRQREDGAICGAGMLSAEGSYTVAYPMAVLAHVRGDHAMAAAAVDQLEIRRKKLTGPEGELYLRCYDDGSRTFGNWARAYAWYLLGLIRTLTVLREAGFAVEGMERCEAEFVRAAGEALAWQAADGLWAVFLNEPLTGPDASGSAGIAAALAIGANAGILSGEARTAAELAWEGLLHHVTPDGILGCVAQSNKGGEALQRSGYRVMFQMATGLLGQLYAALKHDPFNENDRKQG